jgi:hypothetical protein
MAQPKAIPVRAFLGKAREFQLEPPSVFGGKSSSKGG